MAKLEVEALRETCHGKRLKRVERPCNRPDTQEDEAFAPTGIPTDAERRARGERLLDIRPQQVDEVGAVCRRRDLRHRVAHDAHDHHGEAPMLPARRLPQAPHHGERVARHLGILLRARVLELVGRLLDKLLSLKFLRTYGLVLARHATHLPSRCGLPWQPPERWPPRPPLLRPRPRP